MHLSQQTANTAILIIPTIKPVPADAGCRCFTQKAMHPAKARTAKALPGASGFMRRGVLNHTVISGFGQYLLSCFSHYPHQFHWYLSQPCHSRPFHLSRCQLFHLFHLYQCLCHSYQFHLYRFLCHSHWFHRFHCRLCHSYLSRPCHCPCLSYPLRHLQHH